MAVPKQPAKKMVKKKAKPSQSPLPPKASSTLNISALLTCTQRCTKIGNYFEIGSLLLQGNGATFGSVNFKTKSSPYTSSLPGFSAKTSFVSLKVSRFRPLTVLFTAHKGQNMVTCTAKITHCGPISTTFTCK
jgi:hypothetical protein